MTTVRARRTLLGVLWLMLGVAMVGSLLATRPFTAPASASVAQANQPRPVFVLPTATPEAEVVEDESFIPPSCQIKAEDMIPAQDLPFMGETACVGGMAGIYPCSNVDLYGFLPLDMIDANPGATVLASSLWGWTDPQTQREYAIIGLRNGTAFVDITSNPPVFLGHLPTHTSTSLWRELKVGNNHAFIVSDSNGNHGVQIFDLTQLRSVFFPPVTFQETAHYGGTGSIHNIWVNEETDYAYAVGASSGTQQCDGGLHMINLTNPVAPTFAGCFAHTPGSRTQSYVHDTQCVVYNGPDTTYQGHEICFNSNGPAERLDIVDVTNKASPFLISRTPYTGSDYPHQTWLTDDMQYMVLDDELDEDTHNARTYIWDVRNLDAPSVSNFYDSAVPSIDHNQYMYEGYLYQANYQAGLRVLDINSIASGTLQEVGYFDIYPEGNSAAFNAAWNVYPFFASGKVIVSGIEQGLFVLDPTIGDPTPTPTNTPTPSNTPTATSTPTASNTPTTTPTASNTPTATATTKPGTPTPTATTKPSTPTATATTKPGTPTPTATTKPGTPTATATNPASTPTATATGVPPQQWRRYFPIVASSE